ncbi:MAG: nitroreductase family protein [Candidatus Aminicenantes bacterium]|nr:MAG: nitroreductase family protein [Candidatus Aminicenantes bacterium]
MKKISIGLAILLVSLIFHSLLMAAEENEPGLSLKETFQIYVRSIQSSDLKGLFSTVTENQKFFFLTSTGVLIDTRNGYLKFHEDWFKEKDWEMPVELLEAYEGKEYGYTVAIFHYRSKTLQGGMYILDSYFTLVFHKEEGMWKVVADVCTPINRYYTEANSEIKYTSDQAYLFDIIKSRRTVRKFKSKAVPKEHILKILDAARFAPTAGNQQPWKFLVIQDREKLDKLQNEALFWYLDEYKKGRKPSGEELAKTRESLRKVLDNVLSAPVYVAVLVDSKAKYPDYILYDGTLAAGYLMVAARALGYGTGFFTSFFPEAKIREFFNMPDQYKLICFTPIGIPDEWPDTPTKKKLEDIIIFESFRKAND